MYIYIYVYIYMFICIYVYTYIYIHIYMFVLYILSRDNNINQTAIHTHMNQFPTSHIPHPTMHTYTTKYIYIHIYVYIYIYTYTHAYMYIHTCQYTYILAHIYTHLYNIYIYTHACTFGTTARQRLHKKLDSTTRSSALLPVRCNPEGDYPPWPAAQFFCPWGTTDKRRITTTISNSSHHYDSAPLRLQLLICAADPPSLWPTQATNHGGGSNEATFLPFWRVFLSV